MMPGMAIDPVTTAASAQPPLRTPEATTPEPAPGQAAPAMQAASAEQVATAAPADPAPAAQPAPLDPAQDPASWAPVQDAGPRCPWCSEVLPATDLAHCPSCKAQLHGAVEAVPGLTEVAPSTLKPVTSQEPARRSRLLAWISGDMVDEPTPAPVSDLAALAPPSADVRREILRIELESFGIQVPAADEAEPPVDAAEPTAEGDPGPAEESTAA